MNVFKIAGKKLFTMEINWQKQIRISFWGVIVMISHLIRKCILNCRRQLKDYVSNSSKKNIRNIYSVLT